MVYTLRERIEIVSLYYQNGNSGRAAAHMFNYNHPGRQAGTSGQIRAEIGHHGNTSVVTDQGYLGDCLAQKCARNMR